MQRIDIRLCVLVLLGMGLSACGGQPQTVGELPTVAALPTLTDTPLVILTETPTASATFTETPTPTETLELSATPSVTPSATITETSTPTPTITPLPSNTPEPTEDNEGLLALIQLAAVATVLPSNLMPAAPTLMGAPPFGATVPPVVPTCATPPQGGFATVYASDPTLASQLGCPLGLVSFSSASQTLQFGDMLWMAGPPQAIYVLFNTGRFTRYDDTYNEAVDPPSGGEPPPAGLLEPVRGFGKVWRTFGEVRGMGWALTEEMGGQSTAQIFERGQMVYFPQRGMIVVLITDNGGLSGGWRTVVGSF
ncbi:MAG: hypothetical protein LCI00_20410 [Chloroflexi bacterium]|nr:hypothetical protein [Chloroflexota bacterium]MCC6893720.1 hypothetical protein [Anaerolineae bacterium]